MTPAGDADDPRLFFAAGDRPTRNPVDNETSLARLREYFRGSTAEWEMVEQGVRWVFDRCSTQVRYFEGEETASPASGRPARRPHASRRTGSATDIDLLIYGGIARDAFEPATAAEVAGRLGATPVIAFDVTCACAGSSRRCTWPRATSPSTMTSTPR